MSMSKFRKVRLAEFHKIKEMYSGTIPLVSTKCLATLDQHADDKWVTLRCLLDEDHEEELHKTVDNNNDEVYWL